MVTSSCFALLKYLLSQNQTMTTQSLTLFYSYYRTRQQNVSSFVLPQYLFAASIKMRPLPLSLVNTLKNKFYQACWLPIPQRREGRKSAHKAIQDPHWPSYLIITIDIATSFFHVIRSNSTINLKVPQVGGTFEESSPSPKVNQCLQQRIILKLSQFFVCS